MATEAVVVYPVAMSQNEFEPGIYTKGDKRRRVETRADAVAAKFDGYVREGDLEQPEQEPDTDPLHDDEIGQDADPDEDEDAVNGVGTLGTGEVSADATPAPPTPSSVFGA